MAMPCNNCGDLALLTVTAAARVLGISRSTVDQMIRLGEIASIPRGRRGRRIPMWVLREWERTHLCVGSQALKVAVDGRRSRREVRIHA